MANIFGLDLSIRNTGLAILNENKEILHKELVTTNTDMTDLESYMKVSDRVNYLIDKYNVKYFGLENVHVRRARTALRLGKLHGWVLYQIYSENSENIKYYAPTTIKKLIGGKGNCSKEKVATSIQKIYPYLIDELPYAESTAVTKDRYKSDDIYDAIGIALTFIEKELDD